MGLKCACFKEQLYLLLGTLLTPHTSCLHMVLNVNAHPPTSPRLLSIYLFLRVICLTHPISISIHMEFIGLPMLHLSCSPTPCPALPPMTSHLMRMTCMALIPTLKPSLRPSFHVLSTGTHSPLVHVFPLSNMLSF